MLQPLIALRRAIPIAVISLACFSLAAMASPDSQIAQNSCPTPGAQKQNQTDIDPNLKGKIDHQDSDVDANKDADQKATDEQALMKYVRLWFVSKWAPQFSSTEAQPMIEPAEALPKDEVAHLVKQMQNSETVKSDVMAWQFWYQNLLGVVPEAVDNCSPEQKNLFAIKILVDDQKKISAVVEFDSGPGEQKDAGQRGRKTSYAHKIANALNALNGKSILAFPSHSKASQVQFKIQTSFPAVELQAIGNTIQ